MWKWFPHSLAVTLWGELVTRKHTQNSQKVQSVWKLSVRLFQLNDTKNGGGGGCLFLKEECVSSLLNILLTNLHRHSNRGAGSCFGALKWKTSTSAVLPVVFSSSLLSLSFLQACIVSSSVRARVFITYNTQLSSMHGSNLVKEIKDATQPMIFCWKWLNTSKWNSLFMSKVFLAQVMWLISEVELPRFAALVFSTTDTPISRDT